MQSSAFSEWRFAGKNFPQKERRVSLHIAIVQSGRDAYCVRIGRLWGVVAGYAHILRIVAAGSSHPSGGNQQAIKENQRIKKNQTWQEAENERGQAGSVLALGASLGLLWSSKALETPLRHPRSNHQRKSAKKSKNQQSTPLVWETGRTGRYRRAGAAAGQLQGRI